MPAFSLQFFQEQMSKLSKFSLMGMLDFNVQYYGGICSIVVLSITALKLLYGIISFMIKLCLIQKDAKGLMTAIFRAAFAEIFLVTAVTKEEMKQIPWNDICIVYFFDKIKHLQSIIESPSM